MKKQNKAENFTIAPMRYEDIDGILHVEKRSFLTPWSRFAFLCELRDNQFAHYFVAKDADWVIGYAGMWLILNEAHVTNVAVDPAYRGKKVGEALMRTLMSVAREKKADRMTLEVRPSNAVAKNLYKKLGFIELGLRKGYYSDTGEDAIIMWKDEL
jgi:ribosomal-protein-alanine N-acetyltransferase